MFHMQGNCCSGCKVTPCTCEGKRAEEMRLTVERKRREILEAPNFDETSCGDFSKNSIGAIRILNETQELLGRMQGPYMTFDSHVPCGQSKHESCVSNKIMPCCGYQEYACKCSC